MAAAHDGPRRGAVPVGRDIANREAKFAIAFPTSEDIPMTRPVASMLLAQLLAIMGSAIGTIAIPWLLLEGDVSAQRISLVYVAQSGAAVFAALLGTSFLDRLEKKSIYVACDVFLATAVFGLIALYLLDMLNPIAIAAILASSAIVGALSDAAGLAMIPSLLVGSKVDNKLVNGLIGSFHNFGDLVGPVIGGLLIATIGSVGGLSVQGVAFLLSATLIMFFVPKLKPVAKRLVDPVESKSVAYLAGVREIARSPVLRLVTLTSAIINMVITPLLVLLLPVMVKESGGSALGVGALISCFGAGAVFSSALFATGRFNPSPLPSLLGSVMLALISFALIPLVPYYAVYVALLLIGVSVGHLGPLEKTLVQNSSPTLQIGRIILAYSAFRTLLVPVGFLIVGQTLEHASLSTTFFSLAAALGLAVICLIYSSVSNRYAWETRIST